MATGYESRGLRRGVDEDFLELEHVWARQGYTDKTRIEEQLGWSVVSLMSDNLWRGVH